MCSRWQRNSAIVRRQQRVPPVFASRCSRSSSLSVVIITSRPSYTVVDCRRSSFSGRRCSCLERNITSRHVCTVPSTSFWQSSHTFSRSFPPLSVVPVVLGWFYGFSPQELWRKKLVHVCSQNVVQNVVKYAPKCTISKQKFPKKFPTPFVAFGYSFVRPHIEPHQGRI